MFESIKKCLILLLFFKFIFIAGNKGPCEVEYNEPPKDQHPTSPRILFNPKVITALECAKKIGWLPQNYQVKENIGCKFGIKDLGKGDFSKNHSLFLHVDHLKHTNVLYPSLTTGKTDLKTNDVLHLVCTGERNQFVIDKFQARELKVTCEGETIFKQDNYLYNIKNLKCSNNKLGYKVIEHPSKNYKVGFQYGNANDFIETYTNINIPTKSTYSKYKITKYLNFKEAAKADEFHTNSEFGLPGESVDIKKAYQEYQDSSAAAQDLQILIDARKKANPKDNPYYLNRGHLAPKSAFFYTSFGLSTFTYLNTVPQWTKINAGSISMIENKIQKFVSTNMKEITAYTGSLEQLKLMNSKKVLVDVYLYADKNTKKIPVPLYVYSIFITDDKKGIVYIVVNNPFITGIKEVGKICKSPSKIQGDTKNGFYYNCEVEDFLTFNGLDIPDLKGKKFSKFILN